MRLGVCVYLLPDTSITPIRGTSPILDQATILMPLIEHSSQIPCVVAGAAALYIAYKAVVLIYEDWTSPLNDLPGPPNPSLIFGNSKEIWESVCFCDLFIGML